MRRERLIPIIVATGLFMENADSTILATALPAIATDLGVDPIALKLALTAYLVSLAIFIPVSGWAADRFGSRTVFRAALGVFMAGSVACAASGSLGDFVAARFLQGMGGAMMTPVGRLVLLRSIPRGEIVTAMAWLTMPALVGPVIGPPLGGFITTYFDWRWIFIVNLPIGIIGLVLVSLYLPQIREDARPPLDIRGFALSGLGLALLMLGFATGGRHLIPLPASLGAAAIGLLLLGLYVLHARRTVHPLLDLSLLAVPTLRYVLIGGALFRVGVGALPFLLPLMLQLGFGLTPFASGLVTFVSAVGAFAMKGIAPGILRRWGFRTVLTRNAVVSALSIAVVGAFTPGTPVALMLAVLLFGGLVRSLEFTAINTVVYADVPPNKMSAATGLVATSQQIALGSGVALGGLALDAASRFRAGTDLVASDFMPAFLAVATVSLLSVLAFRRLDPEAGADLTGRAIAATIPPTGTGRP